ncbi:hypothetical protein [Ferrimonas balearica]|uniref:hypothetical protein n=1 Tax=Ferrimonas balearica TaxID=44012 RepID=UPI001C99A915|nr:hypothetical protein [Ferrimonas balearica]MBY5921413.1 hypothetical protein [Ferrimonas balearica]MBY5995902.1 hypothetical protein [Ferrimonas balearica]
MTDNLSPKKPKRFAGLITFMALLLGLIGLALYLYVEIALNVTLVSLYSSGLTALVNDYHELAGHVELVGRIISGFGLALGLTFWLPGKLIQRVPLGAAKVRALAFVLLWLISVPSLKLAVEHLVLSTSPQEKLASVRSLLFREALDRELLAFDGATTLNQIVKDEEQRALLVALLPSLALVSNAVDSTIEAQTEEMVVAMMERDQRAYFREQIFPTYQSAWTAYDGEWERYGQAQADARAVRQRLTAPGVMEQKFKQLQKGIDQQLANEWLLYQTAFDDVDEYVEPLVAAFLPEFRQRTPRYRSSKCDRSCRAEITNEWVRFVEHNRAQGFPGLDGITLPDPEDWFATTYVFGREIHLKVVFQNAREGYLEQRFPFDDDLEQEEFVTQPAMQRIVVEYARAQGYQVPDNWQRTDFQSIRQSLQAQAQQAIDKVWLAYQQQSRFKFVDRTMDKGEYARAGVVDAMHRETLGSLYFNGYRRSLGFDALFDRWAETEENANFVRMLTDAAAEAAFSPGGIMYELGVDAVRLSYIPPVAIVASFSAILMLVGRFGSFVHRKAPMAGKGYFALFGLLAVVAVSGVASSKDSYANAMKEFGQQTVALSGPELAFATFLGGVIDAEHWLLQNVEAPSLKQLNRFFNQEQSDAALHQAYVRAVQLDETLYQGLLSALIVKNRVERGGVVPFDFNLAVIKADERVGFYAGLNYDEEGKLSKVSIPNVLASEEVAFALEQRWIYRPDLMRDAYAVVNSYASPDGWMEMRELGKTSLREELERRTLMVMRDSDSRQLRRVHEAYTQGHNNLIFVQRGRGNVYDCYQMPRLSIENIAQLAARQEIEGQHKFECRGEVF